MKTRTGLVAIILVLAGICFVTADESEEQTRRGRGGFERNPEQMRTMILEGIKRQIEASDEEWKVIEPRITKIMALSREQRSGNRGGFGGDRPAGMQRREQSAEDDKSELEKLSEELQTLVNNEDATNEQIKNKLTALRKAREKGLRELEITKAELVSILSLRQEANLVVMGILD